MGNDDDNDDNEQPNENNIITRTYTAEDEGYRNNVRRWVDGNQRYRLIIDPNVTKIREKVFWDCTNLVEVLFHDNITHIGNEAFQWCSNLRRIINGFPDGLLHLGCNAFDSCKSLEG